MTCVFGLLDPLAERREQTLRKIRARYSELADDSVAEWSHGALTILAQSGATAPLDQTASADGWSWVMGQIHDPQGLSPAACVLRHTADQKNGALGINGLNGYYLACCVEPNGAVTLGTDALGFFPLYVWANREVLIFSSNPDLIRLHPSNASGLSLAGLAGILLQGHIANGQTLWQGIRRPDAGHAARWSPGQNLSSHAIDALTPNDRYFGLNYPSARGLFNATLHDAVARAIAHEPGNLGLMLSGGMDSRLVAGHLRLLASHRVRAFIFGDARDIEVRCAAGVAARVDMPQIRIPIKFDAFTALAQQGVRDEQLSNSLLDFGWLSGLPTVKKYGLRMVSGFYGDPIMGGSMIPWAYDAKRGEYSFDALFARVNRWGFSPQEIIALLPNAPMARVVKDVVEEMRARYEALPGSAFQKSSLWGLYNRNRYHVSPYAWRLSSAAWPITPYYDKAMLDIAIGMPLDFIAERRMQIDTLKMDFPQLAQLPLDRNSYDCSPLLPTRLYRLKSRLAAASSPQHRHHDERRAYYRIFDINNAGWQAIRELAEPHRTNLGKLVDPQVLAHWLPAPGARIPARDGIIDTAKHKTLLGLMQLAAQAPELVEPNTEEAV